MKLVFMGTPAFALPTLKALVESSNDIVAVYTQPPRPAGRGQKETPSPVHQLALSHGLKVYTPVSLKSPEAQAEFANHKADIAVVVAYGLLLPKPILEAYPRGCINVHPSKLPRWRGAAPIQRTIMAGDKETAICIMQMDAGLDTGDILLQQEVMIPEGMNAGALHDWLAEDAAPMVLEVLKENPAPRKQSEMGVEYAKKITKDECRIDWNQPAETIYHQILGLSPSPGAWFEHEGEAIKIFSCRHSRDLSSEALAKEENGNPEKLDPCFHRDDSGVYMQCNPGRIYPLELQRPGKKRMQVNEFMAGFKP
ncbi:MAG: methionyl-tRNA formyltransferase [Alphaproteobacteria bacterium]|nr:methionyl-tRNA formyltransferase [Alphaproteobacteria bacterium]